MVCCTRQVGGGSHAVIRFYETHRLVGAVHALNNNLQALSHWDGANGICLKLVPQNHQTNHWEGQMNLSSSQQEPRRKTRSKPSISISIDSRQSTIENPCHLSWSIIRCTCGIYMRQDF